MSNETRGIRIEEPHWQWNGIAGCAPWHRDALDDVHFATDEDLNNLEQQLKTALEVAGEMSQHMEDNGWHGRRCITIDDGFPSCSCGGMALRNKYERLLATKPVGKEGSGGVPSSEVQE